MAEATLWSPFIITNAGIKIRQESVVEGKPITFNYAKIGQGVPTSPANIPLMPDIISPALQVAIVRSDADGETHHIGIRIDNEKLTQSVLMTEVGVYASIDGKAPILYGYGYATQGYDSIPSGDISHYVWTIEIDTVLSRSQNIVFNYDASNIYVTAKDVENGLKELKGQLTDLVDDHKLNKDNPHDVTKDQVGLGNVPNVATNDQTPTYTEANTLTELSSGEKLSVAFGKLAKAVKTLISHISDNVKHITAAERTDWNGKAAANHTHTYIKELVPTKNENNEVDLNKLIVGNSVGFWKIDSRQYTVLNAPTASATQGLLVAVDFENGGFGEQYFSPYASNTRYFRNYYYGSSKVVFGSWTKIFDGANAAAAAKLATTRKINGVGFDGTADITLPNATTTANGLMSKEDKSKLDNTSANLSAHISDNVKHITAAERTDWNGKAAANHTHTYIKELVPTKNENNEVDLNNLIVANSVGFWKIDSRQYTVLHSPTNSATQGLLTAVDFENGGFGEQYFSPYASNSRYFRGYYYNSSGISFTIWTKIFDGTNAAAALKLATARKINGVGFDGTADVTITAAANGGNAQTVNGHTVLSDVPANAKYTDTTYSAATTTANGLMSKEDKSKLDTYPLTYKAEKDLFSWVAYQKNTVWYTPAFKAANNGGEFNYKRFTLVLRTYGNTAPDLITDIIVYYNHSTGRFEGRRLQNIIINSSIAGYWSFYIAAPKSSAASEFTIVAKSTNGNQSRQGAYLQLLPYGTSFPYTDYKSDATQSSSNTIPALYSNQDFIEIYPQGSD